MDEIKNLYKQLKERLKQIEKYLFYSPFKLVNEAGYLGSERQINDTENLHGFVDFVHNLLNEFDNEETTPGLIEMKGKIVGLFAPVIKHLETHPNWSQEIERDIDFKSRAFYVRMMSASRLYKKNGRPTSLSIYNQIRYLYNFLICVSNDLKDAIPESDLPLMDINKPIEKLVLLHQIGMYQFIVDKYGWNTQPGKTAALLANLIGIEPNTKEYKTFASNVRGLNSQPEKVLMPKHLSKIKLELMKIGVEIK
jgi:hypothetical protein